MWFIEAILATLGVILITVGVFKKYINWDLLIPQEDRRTILAGISILFAAGLIGIIFSVLKDASSLISEAPLSLSAPLIIFVLILFFYFTVIGVWISFLMFKALKWIFDVE
jgi:hypothetical protein